MKYPKINERISTLEAYDSDGSLSHAGAEELAELKKALRSIETLTKISTDLLAERVAGGIASVVNDDTQFLKQIRGIDIDLWRMQVATVICMQKEWIDDDLPFYSQKAKELDGLVEVLGIIRDFIDPIKTEEE